jgi:ABC-type antimicrobial peptide transport system permease subunit
MNKIKHSLIALGCTAIVGLVLAVAPPAFAAPSGSSDFTFSFTEDTGIVCGSDASSFDVINSATVHRYGTEFVDQNGNFVKDILYIDTNGTFSNSVTGASIAYKARSIEHDSLAIPGDFNSTFTGVTTGEMQIVAAGSGVVWQNTGRFVDTFYPNGDESFVWNGPHDDLVYGFLGDTSVAQMLCAALGA